jgi:hypothetical protein
MLKTFRKHQWLTGLALLAVAVACLTLLPVHSWADSLSEACNGAGLQSSGGKCTGSGDLSGLIKAVVNILSAIVGVVAVIMIIIGGFRYITSGGEANAVSTAKKTVIYALVGLVVVALAQLIVHFAINTAVG